MVHHAIAAGLLLAGLTAGSVVAATLTVSDGECDYRVSFDAGTMPATRLRATLDHLNDDRPYETGPPLADPAEIATLDRAAIRAACEERRQQLSEPPLLDLDGLAALRRDERAALDGSCALAEAKTAAAQGDLAPLRAYAPAAACGRYVDALAVPADRLAATYDGLLADLCRTSTELNRCMDHLQKEGEKAPKPARMRLAILREGWVECASRARASDDLDARRGAIKAALLKRLKAKALSCAR